MEKGCGGHGLGNVVSAAGDLPRKTLSPSSASLEAMARTTRPGRGSRGSSAGLPPDVQRLLARYRDPEERRRADRDYAMGRAAGRVYFREVIDAVKKSRAQRAARARRG